MRLQQTYGKLTNTHCKHEETRKQEGRGRGAEEEEEEGRDTKTNSNKKLALKKYQEANGGDFEQARRDARTNCKTKKPRRDLETKGSDSKKHKHDTLNRVQGRDSPF